MSARHTALFSAVAVAVLLSGVQTSWAGPVLTTVGPSLPTNPRATSVAYSPNGRFLAVPSRQDKTITMFSISAGGVLTMVGAPTATVHAPGNIDFGRNGSILAVTNPDDDTVTMYTVSLGGTLSQIGAPTPTGGSPTDVAFSSDGEHVAVTSHERNSVALFVVTPTGDLAPGGAPATTGLSPNDVAFAPDGKMVATTSFLDSSVSLFDVSPGGVVRPLGTRHVTSYTNSVAFSPDGEFLATAGSWGGGDVDVWAIGSGGQLYHRGHGDAGAGGGAVTFSPTGALLATSSQQGVIVHAVSNDGELMVLAGYSDGARHSFAFGPQDGRMALLSHESATLSVAAVSPGGQITPIGSPAPTGRGPRQVLFTPGGDRVETMNTGDSTASAFSMSSNGWLTALGAPQPSPDTRAYSPDGRFVVHVDRGFGRSGSDHMTVAVLDENGEVTRSTEVWSSAAQSYRPVFATFSPDGGHFAAYFQGRVQVFSMSVDGEPTALPDDLGPYGWIDGNAMAFSHDGRLLAVADSESGLLSTVVISPDGRLVLGDGPAPIGHGQLAVAVSPVRRLVAVTNGFTDTLQVYEFGAEGRLTRIGGAVRTGIRPESVTFSPDGTLLAVANASDGTVSLFDVADDGGLTEIGSPSPTGIGPASVAFSPDGRWLATANAFDDTVSVFALAAPALEHWIGSGPWTVPGPPPVTGDTTVTLQFESNYPARFECRHTAPGQADAAFVQCATSTTYSGLAEGRHEVSVRARDLVGAANDPVTTDWVVDVSGPEGVDLLAPLQGAVDVEGVPRFSWRPSQDAVAGVERYELWIDGERSDTVMASSCDEASCSAHAGRELKDGEHRWSVRAIDAVGNRTDSEIRRLHVDAAAPAPFGLSGPADGSTISSRRPTLSWQATVDEGVGVHEYDVVVDGNLVARVAHPQTSVVLDTDLDERSHRWNVVARDKYGYEVSSPTWGFRIDTTPPHAALAVSPARFVAPFSVRLDASASSDPGGGRIVAWQFDVDGDGAFETLAEGPVVDRMFVDAGARSVAVRVVDEAGHAATAQARLEGENARAGGEGASYVTIDDRAEFTRDLLVDLRINPPARRGATAMVVSNDGRPDEARQRPIATRVTNWPLASGAGGRDRRTVYVFFYNGAGTQVGERVQDDIRYDPVAPSVMSATLRWLGRGKAELRLRAKDAASGLGRIEVRRGSKLIVRRNRYSARLRIALPRRSRGVRVTVYDRAGNKATRSARAIAR